MNRDGVLVGGLWTEVGDAKHPVCPIFPSFVIHNSPFVIDHSQFSLLNSQLSVRRRAPVVSGARNAMRGLDLRRVRRFFARFKKPVVFKDQVCWTAGCRRTAGYQPAMSATARTSLQKPVRE